jgi:hypothetical protein
MKRTPLKPGSKPLKRTGFKKKPYDMKARKAKSKKPTKSKLVKELDRVFSIFIRMFYADENGFVLCYTCDKEDHWKFLQNGHYISRSHMNTRWDFENCKVQCVGCNVFKHGNYTEYAFRLMAEYGVDFLNSLMAKKNVIRQWSIQDLEEAIEDTNELIREQENRLN